jgi:fructose/tagatose bisphosphate aldolase
MNIDTDLQFAFTEGIRDYMVKNIEYLKTQIGNPEGADVPNKNITIQENGCVKVKSLSIQD